MVRMQQRKRFRDLSEVIDADVDPVRRKVRTDRAAGKYKQ